MGGPGSGRRKGGVKTLKSNKSVPKNLRGPRSQGSMGGFKNRTGSSRPPGRKPKGV